MLDSTGGQVLKGSGKDTGNIRYKKIGYVPALGEQDFEHFVCGLKKLIAPS
jgi:hypothetical protein